MQRGKDKAGGSGNQDDGENPTQPGYAPNPIQRIDIFQKPSAEFRADCIPAHIIDVIPVRQLIGQHIGMSYNSPQDSGNQAAPDMEGDF